MTILNDTPSFYELLERYHLVLPKTLAEAQEIQKESSRPISDIKFDFTDSDEQELRRYLSEEIYTESKVTNPFLFAFPWRFLRHEITLNHLDSTKGDYSEEQKQVILDKILNA